MALKQKPKRAYHKGHHKERHTKRFVKVYAPYLPLLFIVGIGLFAGITGHLKPLGSQVLSYATNVSDDGLLVATNNERTSRGLTPLKPNSKLDIAAQAKADDMAARNYWSHNTPDGQEPWTFVERSGYHYYKAAENLAYGFSSSDSTVSGWMNSPGHRANVLDTDIQDVGFGIVNVPNYQGRGPETIVVAMYGQQSPAVIPTTTQNTPAQFALTPQRQVSYAQTITRGSTPWITFVLGLASGFTIMYLALKHAFALRRAAVRGERFILHHPLLDITLVAAVTLAALLVQTAGNIH